MKREDFMPYFERGNLKLYYEDIGAGEPVITIHGLSEDSNYWGETGIIGKLASHYRVVSIDMRAHGRTVVKEEPFGFDADTMAADFDALADYLGISKFHLLSHATGGMVAVRYAMARSSRLISLMLTDTGSETRPQMYDPQGKPDDEAMRGIIEGPIPEELPSLEMTIAGTHFNPGVFLFKMAEHPYSDRLWQVYDGFLHRQDRRAIITFMRTFYTDPDPRIESLKKIECPTLVLLGEFDHVFKKPSELMAKEIKDVRHVIMKGIGHMTAIEDPIWTANELLDFLDCVAKTGKANW
jgi:pimeloyl-ACP methyl ester carboxylesterase